MTRRPFARRFASSFAVLLLLGGITGPIAQRAPSDRGERPRVFVLDAAALRALRARIAREAVPGPALEELRAAADRALKLPSLSVTEKQQTPPSGDKHDYMSLAPYWWPDASRPNGLPYIRRDGETNPEIEHIQDHRKFDRLMSATQTLALAYYLFHTEAYATHAAKLLRAWFLDPATRMNPQLQFAQAVSGRNQGRGTGLIETRGLSKVVDAIGLLAGSRAWTEADQKGMQDWFSKFLRWIEDSPNGREEAAAKNNHGTYYDIQVVSLALFTGKVDLAKRVIEEVPRRRIEVQIEPDGRQPLELARTKSLGYSTMNLNGLFELARLGENVGVDLWNFQTSDGRSIRKALDFLVPYVTGAEPWPYPQIVQYKESEILPALLTAAVKYRAPGYRLAAAKIDPGSSASLNALLANSASRD